MSFFAENASGFPSADSKDSAAKTPDRGEHDLRRLKPPVVYGAFHNLQTNHSDSGQVPSTRPRERKTTHNVCRGRPKMLQTRKNAPNNTP